MVRYFSIILVLFGLVGCGTKSPNNLAINPYQPTYGVLSDTKIALWIYEGLEKAFKKRGYKIVQNPTKRALKVEVDVLKLSVKHKANYQQDNTFGDLVLRLKLKSNSFLHVKNFEQKNWAKYLSIPTKKEYENMAYKMLESAMDKMIKKIISNYEMRDL